MLLVLVSCAPNALGFMHFLGFHFHPLLLEPTVVSDTHNKLDGYVMVKIML